MTNKAISSLAERMRNIETLSPESLLWTPALLLGLPMLRAAWSYYSADDAYNVYDISGEGRTLTPQNGAFVSASDLLSYGEFDGVNYEFRRASEAGLSFTGGFTIGLWVYVTALPALNNSAPLMSKWLVAGDQREYLLDVDYNGLLRFLISADGTAFTFSIVSPTAALSTGVWHHIVGRFTKGSELAIFVDGVKTVNTTAIPNNAFSGTAAYVAGMIDGGGLNIVSHNGYENMQFLCGTALSDAVISSLFVRSRMLFGV